MRLRVTAFSLAVALCCGKAPSGPADTATSEPPHGGQAYTWPVPPAERRLEFSLVYGLSDTQIMAKRLAVPTPDKSGRFKYCLDLRPETGQAFVSFPHHAHPFIELKATLVEDAPEAKIVDFTLPDGSQRRALFLRDIPPVESAGVGYIVYFDDSCPNRQRLKALPCNDGGGRVVLQRDLKACVTEYRRLYYE